MAEGSPRRAQPNASSADNGEIVPSSPQDVEDAMEDADNQQGHSRPSGDAFGMRGAPDEPDES